MASDEERLRRLAAALDGLAAHDAAALLDAAREEARARVQAMLTDALTESMLDHLARAAEPADAAAPARDPTPSPQPRADGVSADGLPSGTATYVYGVLAAADAARLVDTGGIDPDHPVRVLKYGDLAALVSSVPLADFDEQRLRERLSDMGWVEQVARRHEAVLESTLDSATVVPMRMCTIFRDDDGVQTLLARDQDALREALEHLAGKTEWGLKAFRSAERAPDPAPPQAGPASGTGYLERQQEARRRRERAGAALAEACDAIHRRLAHDSADAVLLSLQRPEVSGHPGEMLLNAAYLVADDQRDAFHEAVREAERAAQDEGIELVPTGPWPAYNFVPDAYRTPA